MKKIIALLLTLVLCIGVFAGCAKENEDLAKAKEYLYSLYVDAATETATDLERPARVKGGNTYFDIVWTVEIVSGSGEVKVVARDDGFVTIDVPEETPEDIQYKLIATIKDAEGNSESLTYEYTVPQFKLTSFAEYAAAESGTLVVAQGVVTAVLSQSNGDSSNSLYFQDNDGGFYAYNLATDPVADGIEVGMTVRVTGQKDLYNGTYEIVSGTAQIIDSNKAPATPADWTEIYKNAADLKDAALTAQQSLLVTLKGVEITKQSDKYLNFKLGDKETYIYISSSNCPGTAEDEANMVATYNEKSGYLANVTGLVTLYNGAFYLTPCGPDAFEYLGLPEKSDAEKIEFEKGNLDFSSSISKDTEIELPAAGQTFDSVAIAWAVEGEGAAIVDGKLVITIPENDSVITVTATLTSGEASETVSFQIKLRGKAAGNVSITLADTIVNGDKVVIYYPDGSLALSGEDDGKKVAGVEAVVNGNALSSADAAIIDVIVDANGYYTFVCDGKYLTAGETGNSMVWADAASDYSLWALEAAENGYYIKSVNAAYNGNAQYMEYYYNFTTYGFSDPAKANIYTFQFYVVKEEAAGTVGDGANVVIYYPDGDSYITANADGNKLAAGTEAEAAVWTISVDANGYYTFICDGKYLTSGETGNSLSLADAASDYSLWELTTIEGGRCYIRNVGANYNGNYNQYLEYYNGFTTYGFNESRANIYTFELIIA